MYDREQDIKDIYKIAGMLEMLTCMQDQPLTSGIVAELVDAVEKLELIGAEMMNEANAIQIDYTLPSKMIDFFGDTSSVEFHCERPNEKVVTVHEGTEEPTPEAHTDDQ